MEEIKTPNKNFIDKSVDKIFEIIFSEDKTFRILLLITLLGFILRIFAGLNLGVLADDMHYAPQAINIISSHLLGTVDSPPIWFYMTDVFYKLFGVSQLTSRAISVIFGTLTILVVFLIAREFLGKKTALLASFLIAISPLHIGITMPEMDVLMTFLVMLSAYFFITFLKNESKPRLILSISLLGIAIMAKYIAITFIPFYFVYFIYKKRGQSFSKKSLKYLVLALFVGFIAVSPILTYNYLLYKDKGLLDTQFARFLNVDKAKQIYSGLAGFDSRFTGMHLITKGGLEGVRTYFLVDSFNFVFALFGIFLLFRKKETRELAVILSALFIPSFIFVGDVADLQKHFVFACPLFAIAGSYFLKEIYSRYIHNKKAAYLGIILLILSSLVILGITPHLQGNFFSNSPWQDMMTYKYDSIPQNSLVLVDARIYRGQIAWMFNDRHYLEASYFPDILNMQQNLTGDYVNMDTFFIECAPDDCGWGTIKDQPDFNKSMEDMTQFFMNNSQKVKTVTMNDEHYLPFITPKAQTPQFVVYRTNLKLKPATLQLVDSTHTWFYMPVRYENMDNYIFAYQTHSLFDSFLNKFAYYLIILEVIFTFCAVLLIFYEL